MKLGPEYIGKLPPGSAEVHNHTLVGYQNAYEIGIISGVEISGCHDCKPSMVFAGRSFPPWEVPQLPLQGCVRSPCCACCYISNVVWDDQEPGRSADSPAKPSQKKAMVSRVLSWLRLQV